jgi:hypothetical protein
MPVATTTPPIIIFTVYVCRGTEMEVDGIIPGVTDADIISLKP